MYFLGPVLSSRHCRLCKFEAVVGTPLAVQSWACTAQMPVCGVAPDSRSTGYHITSEALYHLDLHATPQVIALQDQQGSAALLGRALQRRCALLHAGLASAEQEQRRLIEEEEHLQAQLHEAREQLQGSQAGAKRSVWGPTQGTPVPHEADCACLCQARAACEHAQLVVLPARYYTAPSGLITVSERASAVKPATFYSRALLLAGCRVCWTTALPRQLLHSMTLTLSGSSSLQLYATRRQLRSA